VGGMKMDTYAAELTTLRAKVEEIAAAIRKA
jgi:hypothetical protein